MASSVEVNQRIARVSAHIFPPNLQMEESASALRRTECRAKGGAPGFKVAILGAAGGIGQPLAMLMKMNPLVSVLHLYDVVNAPGVTADISHMDTGAVVRGFLGQAQLDSALTGVDLVIIPAGVPRKPGMTRDDLFKINAGIVKTLCEGIARCCPGAIVNLISNPVNSTVPIAAEVFKKAGTYDPKRLLGVTMLDVVRANTFVAEVLGLDPRDVDVPVVGGHAGVTILPLLSQVKPPCSFSKEETEYLTDRIQNGGTEVVEAKAGTGSATLSMAYAAVKFADACLRGLRGDAGVVECSFVASQVTELPFFATKVRLGRQGAEEVYQLGPLNEYERIGLEKAKKELAGSIEKGVTFIKKWYYGGTLSEKVLGKTLKALGVPRSEYIVATKCGRYAEGFDFSAERVTKSIDESLERLQLDYVDILQCHDIEFGNLDQIVSETIPALQKLKEAGKVRFIGITGLPLGIFTYVLDRVPAGAVDVVLSYCHYGINDSALEDLLPYLKSKGVGVISASPLAMGLLTERGPPEWHPASPELKSACQAAALYCKEKGKNISKLALQYSLSNKDISSVLVGMNSIKQVEENVAAAVELSTVGKDEQTISEVEAILKPVKNQTWPSGIQQI